MLITEKIFNIFFKKDYLQFFAIILLCALPIFFFIGTGILNLGVIILDLIFITESYRKKDYIF